MAISEESRHHLYQRLEEVLGPEEATTLMEHLPPVGWADVATKRDIDDLGAATKRDIGVLREATKRDIDALRETTQGLRADIVRIEGRLDHFEVRFDRLQSDIRTMMLAMLSTMVVLFGGLVALIKL